MPVGWLDGGSVPTSIRKMLYPPFYPRDTPGRSFPLPHGGGLWLNITPCYPAWTTCASPTPPTLRNRLPAPGRRASAVRRPTQGKPPGRRTDFPTHPALGAGVVGGGGGVVSKGVGQEELICEAFAAPLGVAKASKRDAGHMVGGYLPSSRLPMYDFPLFNALLLIRFTADINT